VKKAGKRKRRNSNKKKEEEEKEGFPACGKRGLGRVGSGRLEAEGGNRPKWEKRTRNNRFQK